MLNVIPTIAALGMLWNLIGFKGLSRATRTQVMKEAYSMIGGEEEPEAVSNKALSYKNVFSRSKRMAWQAMKEVEKNTDKGPFIPEYVNSCFF